jgi:hypothetical protein
MNIKTIALVFMLAISGSVNAALVSRLGGLAYYDTEADLTWLADANAGAGSVYDTYDAGSGLMNWNTAKTWAASLNVSNVTGWRLPDTLQPDTSCSRQASPGSISSGFNCVGSEMGNLFYNVLGGVQEQSILTTHNENYNSFSNIMANWPDIYWSATEYAPSTGAWYFNFRLGYQIATSKNANMYAWAVHDGDVALISAVPIPAAAYLFGSALLGLAGLKRKK